MQILDYKFRHKITSFILSINIKGSGLIGNIIAKIILPKPNNEVVIKTKHDFELYIDPKVGSGVEKCLYNYGTYEYGILKLMEYILGKGDIFIDVGANIGLMSIHASKIVGDTGKVYSFEAHPNTAKILQRNVELNDATNVEILQQALGSEKSTGKIYSNLHINRGGASLLKPEIDSECFDVDIIRFDDFYNAFYLPAIKLVKMDIEGFELEALKGFGDVLKSRNAPVLIIECSEERENFESRKEDLLCYIRGINNYHIYKLKGGKERFSKLVKLENELPKHDNIICFLYNHISVMNKTLFETLPR